MLLLMLVFGYVSAETDFERDKRLFMGSVMHLEDALVLAKEISNGKQELIPLYQDEVEEAVRLSGLMNNVYLNHFDSNLQHVFTRYVNGFVLVSRFYKNELNDSEVADLNDKFYAAQMEFIQYTELYPDVMVLEEDESVIAVKPNKSRWLLFLWILLKSVLFVFPLALVLWHYLTKCVSSKVVLKIF